MAERRQFHVRLYLVWESPGVLLLATSDKRDARIALGEGGFMTEQEVWVTDEGEPPRHTDHE